MDYEKQRKIENGKLGISIDPFEFIKRTYLKVPYAEKDEAKALGARWDAEKKQWFCYQVGKLRKWVPKKETNKAIHKKSNKAAQVLPKNPGKKAIINPGIGCFKPKTTIGKDYVKSTDTTCPF